VGAPSGTVTFLFTDVEGSTRRWQEDEVGMRAALARHDDLLREVVEGHGGAVFSTMGDGMAAAFPSASDGVAAALDAQEALAGVLPVRMGVHTGEAELRGGDYFGTAVNRCARLMAAAHGRQVILSGSTESLVRDALAVALIDLGEHRLRDLDRPLRVFQLGEGRFPPLRTLDAFPGNLPLQLSSFVGRERDLARVAAALAESRIVTLTGVGGVGKTRLALQAAAEVLPRYGDGAWLVELAPVRDPAAVADAVAGVFDVAARAGQTLVHALVEFLRGKQLLLVVDNCEHLLEPTAELIEMLERSCPRLAVLTTSREGLSVDGERVYPVPSLASPAAGADLSVVADAPAVRLFATRAQGVKPDFAVTTANAAAVAQVCRRLDGVPLAIELAAARVPAMTPAELLGRLERRFEVLAGGKRGAVERHQTLRATIDWSYELLSEPQQRLLARLTVFAGGCTPDATEAVCAGGPVEAATVWELIAALVARSLVVAEDHGEETRYRLLETIRQYGEERLDEHGETAELRRRHADYYAGLAASLGERMVGPGQVESVTRLAADQENVVRAMNTAIDTSDVDLAFRLLCSVPPAEAQLEFGFQLAAEPALALSGAAEHTGYPIGLAIAALRAAWRGDLRAAEQWCDEAVAAERRLGTHPDGSVDARVHSARSSVAMAVGDWLGAALYSERAAGIYRQAGRVADTARSLSGAAGCHALAGDPDAAVPLATEALALARQVAVPLLIVMCLGALANALADRDPQRARMLLRESLDISATVHHESTVQLTQAVLVAAHLGESRLTLELAARDVPRLHWNGDGPQLGGILNIVAWAIAETEPDAAAVLQGAARRLALTAVAEREPSSDKPASQTGSTAGSAVGLISELRRDASRHLSHRLGEVRLRELRAEGEASDTDQAVAHALGTIDRVLASLIETG
jgi:predicted ATPase